MKNRILKITTIVTILSALTGCAKSDGIAVSETTVPETTESALAAGTETETLLDAFLANEVPAYYTDVDREPIMFDQLPHDDDVDYFNFYAGERVDLDNDGEDEQILNGPYGGMYLDARDEKVYVLAEGEGAAGELSYVYYENAVWIVHSDIMHMGRKMYWLSRYDGAGNITDEFQLSAEYWDSPDDVYDENSDFTFRDKKISMQEYETLIKEIFGTVIAE